MKEMSNWEKDVEMATNDRVGVPGSNGKLQKRISNSDSR